jgi:hypothetical protein
VRLLFAGRQFSAYGGIINNGNAAADCRCVDGKNLHNAYQFEWDLFAFGTGSL